MANAKIDESKFHIKSTPTVIDYYHNVINTQFIPAAKSKDEDRIRAAMIGCGELIILVGEIRLNAMRDEPTNTFYHRSLKMVISHAKVAKGNLKTALTRVNIERRLKMVPRNSNQVNLTPETFKLLLKATKSIQALNTENKTNAQNKLSPIFTNDSEDEEVAASAIARIKQRLDKGETLEQMASEKKSDTSSELLGALKATAEAMDREDVTPQIETLFKPDENGEVEL